MAKASFLMNFQKRKEKRDLRHSQTSENEWKKEEEEGRKKRFEAGERVDFCCWFWQESSLLNELSSGWDF